MIVSQSQLDISNKSYTNKDFADVYTELLTYAEKLSYRFSPISANETDPFIIMLKLAAFVCDKINYNVDKNILERFMISCTQETSMRELSSMMGYYMHYYQSATTDVIFKHPTTVDNIAIPKFSVLTNQNDIQFITLAETVIDAKTRKSVATPAIQGKLKTLSVLGSASIQLENLDANNRLYFPEYAVAENGVFISSDIESDDWVRVDNLNEQEYLSPIFYFGYDSTTRLPYLQFPEWVSKIIGSGLSIKYVISDGYNGNISPGSFTTITRAEKTDEIDDAEIVVVNMSSTINGADPETIEESYAGFKRLVGTLDTLVTCRDYAAAIYDLTNAYGTNLVSNIIVSDRRTDINYGTQVCTVDDFGKTYKNVVAKNESGSELLTPHDICLYPYKPITSYELGSIPGEYAGGYDDAYKFLGTNGTAAHAAISTMLEGSKAISHQYKQLQQDDIVAIYVYLKLNAVISTNVKVSALEAQQILAKINQNLLKAYNSRTITPGVEIPFDALYTTIMNSDTRIKSVSLQEPLQYPAIATLGADNAANIYRSDTDPEYTDLFNFIALKNIVSGRIQLFTYDDRFEYNFYSKDSTVYDNVMHITTEANIKLTRGETRYDYSYVLNPNEAIQIIGPKFNTTVTYPYGVLYNLKLNLDNQSNTFRHIRQGQDYKLQEGEYALFAYADSNGKWTVDVYKGSNDSDQTDIRIINPNFRMLTTDERILTESVDKKLPKSDIVADLPSDLASNTEIDFYMLSANDEVKCKKPVTDHLDKIMYCYWIMNNSDNKILWNRVASSANEYEYILRENEYFYYTDAASTALVEYGSGTKLVVKGNQVADEQIAQEIDRLQQLWKTNDILNVTDVTQSGLNSLAEHFMIMNLSPDYPLDIYINEIKTLTEGDKLTLAYGDVKPKNSSDIPSSCTYRESHNCPEEYPHYNISNNRFKAVYGIPWEYSITRPSGDYIDVPKDAKDENGDPILVTDADGTIMYFTKAGDAELPIYNSAEGVRRSDADGNPIIEVDEFGVEIWFDAETGKRLYDTESGYTKTLQVTVKEPKYEEVTVTTEVYPDIIYIYDSDALGGDTSAEAGAENLLPDRSSLPEKYRWQIRGLLDLNCGPDQPQYLYNDNKITLKQPKQPNDNSEGEVTQTEISAETSEAKFFNSNVDITINGGENVNLNYIDAQSFDTVYPTFMIATTDTVTKNFLKAFDGEFYTVGLQQASSEPSEPWVYLTSLTEVDASGNPIPITFYLPPMTDNTYAGFSIYVPSTVRIGAASNSAQIQLQSNDVLLRHVNPMKTRINDTPSSTLSLHPGVNNIIACMPASRDAIANRSFKIQVKGTTADNYIQITGLRRIDGLNSDIGFSESSTVTDVLSSFFDKDNYLRIPNLEQALIFGNIDKVHQIEVSEDYPLSSAQGFYDRNNIANAWVLPRIDFKNSVIKLASNSLK